MGKPKGKIDVSAASGPLHDPFSVLAGMDLPEREVPPEPEPLPAEPRLMKRGRVVLRRETAGRGGKVVVVVGDFPETMSAEEIAEMARSLRRALGCGGTVRGREIEVQGERTPEVRAWLEGARFRVVGP